MWSFLRESMITTTTLVPGLPFGGVLRMRSVRSHPVAPSREAPTIPAPESFRNSLRERILGLRGLTRREGTTLGGSLQAGRAQQSVNPPTWGCGATVRIHAYEKHRRGRGGHAAGAPARAARCGRHTGANVVGGIRAGGRQVQGRARDIAPPPVRGGVLVLLRRY